MRLFYFFISFFFLIIQLHSQTIQDDFEGAGNITYWSGDDCNINIIYANPFKQGVNLSNTVLKYEDVGGQYANVRFDTASNLDINTYNKFVLKIYVPSSNVTGNSPNQISLKLQNSSLGSPWSTQTEIIKPILLNQWQVVSFDFENDAYINLDGNSLPPNQRTDFNRVLLQVNGENNTNTVIAYIDDFYNESFTIPSTVYDTLIWSDEFDGTGAIDDSKWFQQTQLIAGTSWANGEVQHYTNRQANSYVDNGTLKIKAIKENFSDQGVTKNYTSARLNSKFTFKYGRVEVRAKVPSVAGAWPAIWLLGKNINEDGGFWDNQGFGTTSWPWCGEIDIMEPNVAKNQMLATWHWNNGSGYQINSKGIPTSNANTSQNFHNYVLEWNETSMKIYMNAILINEMPTVNPFNQDFYVLLNVAMGGSLGGTIDPNFTSDIMEIDYIRVYQSSSLSVSKNDKSFLSFYPNPVKDKLYITLENSGNKPVNLEVVDFNGRIIYSKQHISANSKLSFDTGMLKFGMYFIRVTTQGDLPRTFKFVKN